LYTTKEMKQKTGKADFEYEISCDQMCGTGHFTMRGVINVVTEDEFIMWRAKQKPAYAAVQNALPQPITPTTNETPAGTPVPSPINEQPENKGAASDTAATVKTGRSLSSEKIVARK